MRPGKSSGCIIDTSGILDQSIGTDLIRDIVAEFSVTVIVVLGHERLYNDMARRYGGKPGVSVVKLARSGGAVERSDTYLQQLQNYITKQYFYGEWRNILSPVSRTLDFKYIKVYRIAEGNACLFFNTDTFVGSAATHASALPIGQEDSIGIPEIDLVQLESPAVLQHSILAITTVGIDEEPRGILESNVFGFVFV
jgi:polyribonucleotide 5'-hydroxyl-kinase